MKCQLSINKIQAMCITVNGVYFNYILTFLLFFFLFITCFILLCQDKKSRNRPCTATFDFDIPLTGYFLDKASNKENFNILNSI